MEYKLYLEGEMWDPDHLLDDLGDMRIVGLPMYMRVETKLKKLIRQVFDVGGYPPWAPLSEVTVFERLALGFGEGPILVRTGTLRETYLNHWHPDHVLAFESTKNEASLTVGSRDYRAVDLAEGDPSSNLPARPPFPDDTLLFPAMFEQLVSVEEALIYG